jgi:hypothetical protein
LYKANKDQVNVFGFRTQYGGGKSTGFALIYDSHEAMKKFEPHYRLVRIGAATKIEKASRQQRMFLLQIDRVFTDTGMPWADPILLHRKATQEQIKGIPGYGEDEGCIKGQEEMSGSEHIAVRCGGCCWSLLSTGTECCGCGSKGHEAHFCAGTCLH